jgi:hypothetical protein
MKQMFHIFRKDVRLYWIEILATIFVTALFVWLYRGICSEARGVYFSVQRGRA